MWWFTREHFPVPVSRLFATLFPPTVVGWRRAAARYGWSIQSTTFAASGTYLFYSPGETDWEATLALDPVAERTLTERTWRHEVRRWEDDERPTVLRQNLALQGEDIASLSDAGLADHIARAIAHFLDVAPLHFEHSGFDLAAGMLFRACDEWGVEAPAVAALLSGASPATAAVSSHLDAIVSALEGSPATLDEVPSAVLEPFLTAHSWRVIDGNDLVGPTLGERPGLMLAAIRAHHATGARHHLPDVEAVRERVPAPDRERFDGLLADARALYALRDDDNGVCFVWPLGLVRRGVLEAADRLVERGRLDHVDDLFEAEPSEIAALLGGRDPSADELAGRRAFRLDMASVDPPSQLGEMGDDDGPALPPHVAQLELLRRAYFDASGWHLPQSSTALQGIGIGAGTARGRACLLADGSAVDRIEAGDVLIAITTTPNLNAVFPLLVGVATEEGGLFSHTALLARELGIPAVVGAPGLLTAIRDGDLVEIDADTGVVRIVERPA